MTPPDTPRLRILLADDDYDARFLTTRILTRLGHDVAVAADGLEAIGLLRDNAWDIVLSDYNMPGASGIDVLERAYRLQPSALRVLVTAFINASIMAEARARGHADAVIEKPLNRESFESARRVSIIPRLGEFEIRLARR